MPRNTFDITNFSGGSVPSADRTNVQPPAMAYILDGDPEPQVGAVSQRRNELLVKAVAPTLNFGPVKNGCTLTRNDGKYDIIYHQFDAVKSSPKYAVRALEDFGTSYFAPGTSDLVTLTSADTDVTFEPTNETVRMGYANTETGYSRFIGYIRNGQFGGSAPSGLQTDEAECKKPNDLPPVYKTFVWTDSGTRYIIAVSWQAKRLLKIRESDGEITYGKEIFSKIQGLCDIDGTYCYVFDATGEDGLGDVMKVKISDFSVIEKYTMSDVYYGGALRTAPGIYNTVSHLGGEVSDLECTTNYLVFGVYQGVDGAENLGATGLAIAKSSLVADSTFIPQAIGIKVGPGVNMGKITAMTAVFSERRCLHKSPTSTEIGMVLREFTSLTLDNGAGGSYSGQATNWFVTMNETHLGGSDLFIDDLYATNVRGSRLTRTGGSTTPLRHIVLGASDAWAAVFDGYVYARGSRSFLTISGAEAWDTTTVGTVVMVDEGAGLPVGSDFFMNEVTVCYSYLDDVHFYFVAMTASDQLGWINDTRGRLIVLDYNNDSYLMNSADVDKVKVSEANIYLTSVTEPIGDGPFTTGKRVYYRVSYIYDGYQESPMCTSVVALTSTAGQSIQVKLLMYKNMSTRVTGINIYRAESDATATSPQGYYRLVDTVDMGVGWATTTTEASVWGNYYTYAFVDSGKYGVSFEDNTQISEDVEFTGPNYKLQCMIGGYHFIANCYHPYYDDATHMLFRSKLNAPDMFDVSKEFLHLPVLPTAIAAFAGSIWVFDKTHLYRVNPQTLVIEDTTSGVGCLGPRAVCVSDSGMFFADEQTIWHFDGSSLQDIGAPIQTAFDSSHINHRARIAAGNAVQLLPWPAQRMVMVFYWGTEMYYYGYSTRAKSWWAYKTTSGIWDGSGNNMLAGYTKGAFLDIHRGQIFSGTGTTTDGGLIRFWASTGDSGNQDAFRQLEVYTGGFTAGDQSQRKKLYGIEGDASTAVTLTRAVEGSTSYGSMVFGEIFKEMAVKAVIGAGGTVNTLRGLSIMFRPLIGKR